MKIKKVQIAAGANLNIIETDKFKSDFLSVNFIVPLDRKTAGLNALLPRVLKRGTKEYPTMSAICKRLDYLYSTDIVSKNLTRGEAQIITFSADMLSNRYAPDGTDILGGSAELLCEIIYSPLLDKDRLFEKSYFDGEIKNHVEYIDSLINDKGAYASNRARQIMCKNEAYGVSADGEADDFKSVTREMLMSQYINLLSTADIEIFFVGMCDEKTLENKLRAYIESVKRNPSAPVCTNVVRRAEKVTEVIEQQIAKQGKLVMGFRSGCVLKDGNYPVFSLFTEVFGGTGSLSKLFMNVREKLSLCYYCSASTDANKGIMMVRAGIDNDNYENATKEILAQLKAIQNGDVSEKELSAAKLSLINAYNEIYDNPASVEAWYLGRSLAGRYEAPEKIIDEIRAVTKEQICEISKGVSLDTIYFLKGGNIDENDDE